jgi:hypothetical protein
MFTRKYHHALAATIACLVIGAGAGAANGTTTTLAISAAAAKPTLAVAVLGGGRVTSTPAGISCPGKCSATFAAGARVVLSATAKTGSRFLRWGGNCKGAGACRVKVSALSAVAAQFAGGATQPRPTTSVEPGTYQGYALLYVPAGARSVLNFSTGNVSVNCAGGGRYLEQVKILKATIRPDRSFTAKTSQSAVIAAANATITYTVTGRFLGRDAAGRATASGVYRIDTVFSDTPSRKCTSNDKPWTTTRLYPPATTSVEPGTYQGSASLSVPAGARSVANFSTGNVYVNCAGGGTHLDQVKILKATIRPDRSFTAKTSQSAVIAGADATVTYTVTGYFQGPDAAGRATASGVYRIDTVFSDTPSRRCTSNDRPWTATRTG